MKPQRNRLYLPGLVVAADSLAILVGFVMGLTPLSVEQLVVMARGVIDGGRLRSCLLNAGRLDPCTQWRPARISRATIWRCWSRRDVRDRLRPGRFSRPG